MLTRPELNRLDKIWNATSDSVRIWIRETVAEAQQGNIVAEKEAQRFLRLSDKHGSGIEALRRLNEHQGEQLRFE